MGKGWLRPENKTEFHFCPVYIPLAPSLVKEWTVTWHTNESKTEYTGATIEEAIDKVSYPLSQDKKDTLRYKKCLDYTENGKQIFMTVNPTAWFKEK